MRMMRRRKNGRGRSYSVVVEQTHAVADRTKPTHAADRMKRSYCAPTLRTPLPQTAMLTMRRQKRPPPP
jgi:hypothetical protein